MKMQGYALISLVPGAPLWTFPQNGILMMSKTWSSCADRNWADLILSRRMEKPTDCSTDMAYSKRGASLFESRNGTCEISNIHVL